jgi:DNA replication and repair protein RecF
VWLSWLELLDWRSYEALTWQPDPGVNVLVGPNGAGKTSVLEAVAYLSSARSFRGTAEEGLVRAGAE